MAEGEGKLEVEEKAEENAGEKDEPAAGTPKGSGDKAPLQFASLYVGDLHPDIAEATLYEAFQSAGNVASCRVCRDSVSRKSLCYGYVNYYTVEDAEKALDTLNYMSIKGRPCRIMWSQRDAALRKNTNSNIFVKGLDPSIDNKALHDTFSVFGHILSCKVSMDNSGKSRGYGFVHYEAEQAAKEAVSRVNGMKVGESIVTVAPFKAREGAESKDADDTYTNLYIKNMPDDWDDGKILSIFGEFGEVVSSVSMKTDDDKRFALVNFQESDCAKAAVEALHKKDMRDESEILAEKAAKELAEKEAKEKETAKAEEEKKAEDAGADETKAEEEKKAEDAGADETKGDAVAEEAAPEGGAKGKKGKDDDHPDHLLYVQRAQTRSERQAMLAERKSKKGSGKGKHKEGVRLCVRNLGEATTMESLKEIFEPYGTILDAVVRLSEETGKCRGVGFVTLANTQEATKAISETHLRMVDGKPLNVGLAQRRLDGEEKRGDRRDGGAGGRAREKGKGRGRGGRGQADAAAPLPGAPLAPLPPYPGGLALPPYQGGLPGMPGLPGFRPGMPLPPHALARPGMPFAGAYSLPPALAGGAGHPGTAPAGALPHPCAAAALGLQGRPLGASALLPPVIPSMHAPFPSMMQHLQDPRLRMPGMHPYAPPPPPTLTKEALAAMPPQAQKQVLGERLFSLSFRYRPDLAGKVTGMMLELDNNEIVGLLSDEVRLRLKIDEAVGVLHRQAAAAAPAAAGLPAAK